MMGRKISNYSQGKDLHFLCILREMLPFSPIFHIFLVLILIFVAITGENTGHSTDYDWTLHPEVFFPKHNFSSRYFAESAAINYDKRMNTNTAMITSSILPSMNSTRADIVILTNTSMHLISNHNISSIMTGDIPSIVMNHNITIARPEVVTVSNLTALNSASMVAIANNTSSDSNHSHTPILITNNAASINSSISDTNSSYLISSNLAQRNISTMESINNISMNQIISTSSDNTAQIYVNTSTIIIRNDSLNYMTISNLTTSSVSSVGIGNQSSTLDSISHRPMNALQANESIIQTSSEKVFWNVNTGEQLLSHVQRAEQELKIFVYPIPRSGDLAAVRRVEPLPHFKSE